MPLTRRTTTTPHQQSVTTTFIAAQAQLVEIMDVDPYGDCMVLNVTSPLDGEWQHVSAAQIASSFWERVAPDTHPTAA